MKKYFIYIYTILCICFSLSAFSRGQYIDYQLFKELTVLLKKPQLGDCAFIKGMVSSLQQNPSLSGNAPYIQDQNTLSVGIQEQIRNSKKIRLKWRDNNSNMEIEFFLKPIRYRYQLDSCMNDLMLVNKLKQYIPLERGSLLKKRDLVPDTYFLQGMGDGESEPYPIPAPGVGKSGLAFPYSAVTMFYIVGGDDGESEPYPIPAPGVGKSGLAFPYSAVTMFYIVGDDGESEPYSYPCSWCSGVGKSGLAFPFSTVTMFYIVGGDGESEPYPIPAPGVGKSGLAFPYSAVTMFYIVGDDGESEPYSYPCSWCSGVGKSGLAFPFSTVTMFYIVGDDGEK